MPNRDIFNTGRQAPPATARNASGGRAYALSDQEALAQYAVTGTFNRTFVTSARSNFTETLRLARACSPEWVAKVAIYARQHGLMKDVPVFLVAYLSTLEDKSYFYAAFPYVVNNIGQVRNFVQMIRSGVLGRKSLGTAPKRAIQRFLAGMPADRIFWQCAGNNPSMPDVLALVHPRPVNAQQDALYGYLLGREYNFDNLPTNVQQFERFKSGDTTVVPAVDFRRLTALPLTVTQWTQIAGTMTWNQLRLNMNTLARHGVFADTETVNAVANRLRDERQIAGSGILPFALYNTIENVDAAVPRVLVNALQDALEICVLNAPRLPGRTLVAVDSSGSMSQPVTGYRSGSTSTLKCNQAAAFFAAAMLRANPDNVDIICFDTQVTVPTVNPRDSLTTITRSVSRNGGGTSVSSVMVWARQQRQTYDNIVIISDNESWADRSHWYGQSGTSTQELFTQYRGRSRNAKLVLWDVVPSSNSQVSGTDNTLRVGGFSDAVFSVIDGFTQAREDNHWQTVIGNISLS